MKLRSILCLVCIFPLLASCASKQPDPCPNNLEPMYGSGNAPVQCQALNKEFLAAIDAKGLDRAASSTETAKLGFDYLLKGDRNSAMKRFNQAWLLDPQNCMPFNGFGIIKHTRDHDSVEAVRMFDMALERCPDNGIIMSDYGRVLEESGQLHAAVSMLEKSLRFSPTNLEAYKGLVRAHIKLGNDKACLNAIRRGREHGLVVDRRLVQELERRIGQAQ